MLLLISKSNPSLLSVFAVCGVVVMSSNTSIPSTHRINWRSARLVPFLLLLLLCIRIRAGIKDV